jgi:ABC-type lipoprotein release transport system permease subunit
VRLYLRLAWRNAWRHRRRTVIVMLAIGLCLWLLMLYDGMVVGFEQAIYGNAIQVLGGNIQIHAAGYRARAEETPLLPLGDADKVVQAARARPEVRAATRRINTGGMVTSREGAFAVAIVGLEPEQELPVNLAAQKVVAGRYLTAADKDVIYIGQGLAEAMGVGVGERITLVGRATHEQMRRRTMTLIGIYDVGIRDVERRTVYMALGEAQELYGLSGQCTEVALALQQIGQERAVMNALKTALPDYEIASWETSFPDLQQALTTKGGVMNVFGVIILGIAAIGILNMLLMAVYERTREIGLLSAFGMKPRQISLLFILEGLLIGLAGAAFGVVLGVLINGLLGWVGLDYSKFTSLTDYTALITGRVYPTLGLEKLPGHVLTVVIITILASFYPAYEAAQSEPAQALHYV